MKIYSPSAGDGNSIVVRWNAGGKEDFAHGPASEGVAIPRNVGLADLLDIIITGPMSNTLHIAFDPAHAEFYAEEAA